jgi:hypothetical protein
MSSKPQAITILMADDDADDRKMTQEAFEESRIANDLRFVVDGEELMDYLKRRGRYEDPASSPRPASYITKPVTFEGLVDVIRTLGKYWLEIVELPNNGGGG